MKQLTLFLMVLAFSVTSVFAGEAAKMTKQDLDKKITEWSQDSKKATDFMVKKYGMPDGVTPTMLVWNNVKPFKRSIVYKEAITHKFPKEHKDVLEHFIDYKAPAADKVAKVWEFDGSVILEKTKGEMSARCDKEEANILALNLADDVINDRKTVEEARMEFGRQIMALMDGKPKELTQKLVFSPASGSAGDPDQPVMDKVKSMQAQESDSQSE